MTRGAAILRGRVLTRAGTPATGAGVVIMTAPAPVADIAALTGSDGTFILELPASGAYEIAITYAGSRLTRAVSVGEGATETLFELP